jgi:methylmalonyl-CoA/ethylmalonyl-CoA epimerase
VTGPVFDHVAVGVRDLTDGWQLFGGLLGGRWVYGGDSAGFWWGQVQFAAGPKVELITPDGGPDSGFLERFLTARGPGLHHYNFVVPDIERTLANVTALGIEPVGVRLGNPRWKEGFLHPRDAYGIVVQVAEQSGPPPDLAAPAALPPPGPASALALAEQHVRDLAGAARLFRAGLGGEVTGAGRPGQPDAVELTWPNGARLRLVQMTGPAGATGAPGPLTFTRDGVAFSPAECAGASALARRLGVSLQLSG